MEHDHVATVKIGEARVTEGSVQIVHNINTTLLLEAIGLWETVSLNESSPSTEIIRTKIKNIKTKFIQTRPICKRTRSKRWDKLGTGWKWLAGSPDADDLRTIVNNYNKVVDNNNNQILINQNFDETISNVTSSIEELTKASSQDINDLYKEVRFSRIIYDLGILDEEVEQIQNSMILSKLKLINPHLLGSEEIKKISEYLENQDLPFDSLTQALSLSQTDMSCKGETISYVINLPYVTRTKYDLLRIEAISRDSEKITLPGKYFLRSENSLFVQLHECTDVNNIRICRRNDIQELPSDNCLVSLLKGHHSSCN